MATQRYGTPRTGAAQSTPRSERTARDERSVRTSRSSRTSTGSRSGRSWPQLAVFVGVIVLLIIGFVLMLRPAQRVQQDIYPVAYQDAIVASCERHGVNPYLVCAIIKCESSWRDEVVSNVGAVGLMQVMPSTATTLAGNGYVDADAFPPENLQSPVVNIEYGCATLEFLSHYLSTEEEVVAAYNAGLGTVQSWLAEPGDIPFEERITYAETKLYLARVLDARAHYEELYDLGLSER